MATKQESEPLLNKAKPAKASVPFTATEVPPASVLFNPLIWVFWILDLVLYLLLPLPGLGLVKTLALNSKGVQSTLTNGEARRANGLTELASSPGEGVTTVYEMLQVSFKKHADRKCMGTRTFLGWHKPEKARFPLKVFGETTWKSYAEVDDQSLAFGRGLRALGMQPLPKDQSASVVNKFTQMSGPHCLLIFEETCADWMLAAIGAFTQSIVAATSYSTLGMSAVAEAINECQSPAILCNYKDVERVSKLQEQCPSLQSIIYSRNYVEDTQDELPASMGRLRVLSVEACIELGNDSVNKNTAPYPPTKDHLGLIMYTSGSTGKPKGVMLKHSSIVAAVGAFVKYVDEFLEDNGGEKQEVYLGYLPAAHILEFAIEMGMFTYGAAVGYADPKTISSKGAVRQRPDGTMNFAATGFGKMPPGAIQEFAPTLLAAVPKIWDILKKGVESEIGKQSGAVQAIFGAAFAGRSLALKQGRKSPLCDLIFKKTYDMLGGRLKLCVSGGGPLSPDIQNFIRVAFRVNLVQGYGLTETCAAGSVQPFWSVENAVVGPPVKSDEFRLNSCTEVLDHEGKPYLNTDRSHMGTPCLGRGEVWIRGPSVSSGYYMMEEKTRESFDDQGWFHTGDIGMWTTSGMMKIVDRLKNLVKLKGGEYIAIESMEATYAQSVFVNGLTGGIMCYGDGDMDRPVALVQVNDHELKKWADSNGVKYSSIEDLCKNPAAAEYVCQDLNSIAAGRLGGNEKLAAVALLPGTGEETSTGLDAPWTPENQYLTASNKLNRKPILKGFDSVMKPLREKGIR